jgi:hypothetical protein
MSINQWLHKPNIVLVKCESAKCFSSKSCGTFELCPGSNLKKLFWPILNILTEASKIFIQVDAIKVFINIGS